MNIIDNVVFIPICCACDRVRDDQQTSERPSGNAREQWVWLESYLHLYRIPQDAYRLTHTYCPRCMKHLGINQKKPEQRETLQEEIRQRIISVIGSAIECDLDTLVSRCDDFSWGQIFLEMDNMSRIGVISLTRSAEGRYCLGLPRLVRSDEAQILGG
ncbi:MAG: hypothetical protein H7Y39_11335 [Nitrospiraceae bacterium]|nr:hypothetical protein [Nitrospiraceae bacterium]